MPLQIRAPRVVEDRKPIVGKVDSNFASIRPRRALHDINNVSSNVVQKIADLKISGNTNQKTLQRQTAPKVCLTNNVKKCDPKLQTVQPKLQTVQSKLPIQPKLPVVQPRKVTEEKNAIEDVDKLHIGNMYLVSEYAQDVYTYLMTLEVKYKIEKWPLQDSVITETMRTIIIDWLVDVHVEFRLLQETLHAAVQIMDRYLQVDKSVQKNVFQLIGICALSIAGKYEEMLSPCIEDYLYLCKDSYRRQEFLNMEMKILEGLNFDLGRPASIVFLRRYDMVAKADRLQHCYAKFFVDLALLDSKLCHIRPSMVAAAAAFLGICIMKNSCSSSLWTNGLAYYSTYSFSDVKPVASQLARTIISYSQNKHDSVRRKYSTAPFLNVSSKVMTSMELLKKIANSNNVAVNI